MYRPKVIKGKVSGTGWPIDGHVLYLSQWSWDNYRSWHLYSWEDESDEAVMRTMFQTEQDAGFCVFDTLDEFKVAWETGEWNPIGTFCIELENVEVLEVIQEEEKENKREIISPRKENDYGGILCMPRMENLPADAVKEKHPDWRRARCPRCGHDCWKPANADELQRKEGVKPMCTNCALAASAHVPVSIMSGENREMRRRAKCEKRQR